MIWFLGIVQCGLLDGWRPSDPDSGSETLGFKGSRERYKCLERQDHTTVARRRRAIHGNLTQSEDGHGHRF